jgi:hypothetical protein
LVGSRLLRRRELGHEAQPLRDTSPIGRIGPCEMCNLAQLDRFRLTLHCGGDIVEQLPLLLRRHQLEDTDGLRPVLDSAPFDGLACHPTRHPEVFCWNDLRKWSRQVRVLMRPADHEGKACGRRFKLF